MIKQGSTRIHIDFKAKKFPVIFSYHQLKEKEQKASGSNNNHLPASESAQEDAFFRELLKKAENYNLKDEENTEVDDDDDGSDDDSTTGGLKNNDYYDFEDPFIDDSEMLLEDSFEYDLPEINGFFVYKGPLDSNESVEEKKTPATGGKRKAAAKPKSVATANGKVTKTRKKEDTQSATSTTSKSKNASKKPTTQGEPMQMTLPFAAPKPTIPTTTSLSNHNDTTPPVSTKKTTKTVATPKPVAGSSTTAPALAAPTAGLEQNNKQSTSATENIERKKMTESKNNEPPVVIDLDTIDDKKKKATEPPTLYPLDRELEMLMEDIREEAAKESFVNKARFPESLKPYVLKGGLICFRRSCVLDTNFIYHLMCVLPYNRFTLKKFVTTKSGQMRVDELQQEIDELAIQLKQTIDKMMPVQQETHELRVASLKQAKAVKVAAAAATNNGIIDVDALEPDEEITPKFKFNDDVRKILYDIMKADEQCNFITNVISTYKNVNKDGEKPIADGQARKLMYQRLLSCWPDGWMISAEVARQYNSYKKKIESTDSKKRKQTNQDNNTKGNGDGSEEQGSRQTSIKVESLVNM